MLGGKTLSGGLPIEPPWDPVASGSLWRAQHPASCMVFAAGKIHVFPAPPDATISILMWILTLTQGCQPPERGVWVANERINATPWGQCPIGRGV